LAELQTRLYNLVISDFEMDDGSGLELLKGMRAHPVLKKIPVIMVTARTADEDISKGFSSGTDIYIEKPFKPSELVAFVRRFVGPAKPDAHP
jgi:DNA-binding response OmpR family regulator